MNDASHIGALNKILEYNNNGDLNSRNRVVFLDQLRAVAVITVVIHHYNSDWLPGGGFGVGLFFAISGFLISTILLETSNLNLKTTLKFLIRRFMRIYPLYFITILAAMTLAYADDRTDILTGIIEALPGLLSMVNMPSWLGYGIGVLWTLHVEFAFYITISLAMLIFGPVRGLILVCFSLLLFSFLYFISFAFNLDFNLLHNFTIWSSITFLFFNGSCLSFGSLLALFCNRSAGFSLNVKWSSIFMVSGFGIYIFAMYLPPVPMKNWVIGATLASVAGCLIIASCLSKSSLSLIPGTAWIGRISYSIYLVHGLVLDYGYSFFDIHISPSDANVPRAYYLFAVATIVVSAAAYILIEVPGIKLGRLLANRFGVDKSRPAA